MGKKFVGLDGLKHFWTKAKTWIAGQITAEVTAKIAEIVANAPEDLDTLKEIADWIKTHANDASAMNTQINTNKNNIAALQTSVAGKAAASHTHDDRYFTETEVTNKLAGKSDTGHTHDDRYFTETEVTNKLKTIMQPNYIIGKLPAGKYSLGQKASVGASIKTTRGNPVFITYSGDFNTINSGNTAPWISFKLYADDKLIQNTVVDNSVASDSDNTSFAGCALAVLSAGSHTIRLDAELRGSGSSQIQFQEQDNYFNLVAFEL